MKNKISIAQYNEKLQDLAEAKAELLEAKLALNEIEECEVVDNCQKCQGIGEIEDGTGDPGHNPYGHMLYRPCPDCEGKGYIEN